MKYSTDNLLVSFQRELANRLLAAGYDVRWHTTQEIEYQTGLETALGTVTLVPEFPPNPAYLVRSPGLNDGSSPQQGEVMVPAFAVSIPNLPSKIRRAGIGQSEFERWRTVYIDGFAYDEFQQRALTDLLYEWLEIGDTSISIWDYSTDPSSPATLDAALVIGAKVKREEWIQEIDAIRYNIEAEIQISYFE